MKLGHEILETISYRGEQNGSLYLTWALIGIGTCPTGQTDRRTDRRTKTELR